LTGAGEIAPVSQVPLVATTQGPEGCWIRIFALTILAIGTMLTTAHAQTYDPSYPVCLHVYGPDRYIECAYTSLPQCSASASGRSADCVINPLFASGSIDGAPSRRRWKHGPY
jgi:Protein of unknown function (DUF3551)